MQRPIVEFLLLVRSWFCSYQFAEDLVISTPSVQPFIVLCIYGTGRDSVCESPQRISYRKQATFAADLGF